MSRAPAISLTGMMPLAPLLSAVVIEVVARRISKTTHTASLKSRCARGANSAGDKITSRLDRFIRQRELRFWVDALSFAYNETNTAEHSRRMARNKWL